MNKKIIAQFCIGLAKIKGHIKFYNFNSWRDLWGFKHLSAADLTWKSGIACKERMLFSAYKVIIALTNTNAINMDMLPCSKQNLKKTGSVYL